MKDYNCYSYRVEPLNGSYRIVNDTLVNPIVIDELTLEQADTLCLILTNQAEYAYYRGYNQGYNEGYMD